MLSLTKKEPKSLEVLAKHFEVEELEERLEFATWKASGDVTYNPGTGECTVTVGVSCTF